MNYQAMAEHELAPGVLCTVLQGRKQKPKSIIDGQLVTLPRNDIDAEYYAMWRGWPLRVMHVEQGTPFVLFQVLRWPGTGEHAPERVLLDVRRAQFCRVSREFARQFLGIQYQTTL